MLKFGRWLIRSNPRRYEQFKLLQHLPCEIRVTIVPCEDPLRRISPAQQVDVSAWILVARLSRNLDKKAAVGDTRRDTIVYGSKSLQHRDPLIERRPLELLVRERPRNREQHFVYNVERGVARAPDAPL